MVQFEVLLDTSDNACFDIEPRNGKLHLAFLNVYTDANYVFLFSYAQSWLQERSYRYFQARRGQSYSFYSHIQIQGRWKDNPKGALHLQVQPELLF